MRQSVCDRKNVADTHEKGPGGGGTAGRSKEGET